MEESLEKNKLGKIGVILILLGVVILFLLVDGVLMRAVSARQVDDFSPQIYCSQEITNKSEILMVIPLYNNISIAENKTWCEQTLRLNKTLGMHGVYHSYNEFLEPRDLEYIKRGMEEFKKCFGYYPRVFEAPQLALNRENRELISSFNMTVNHYGFNALHKVYHCSDTGKFKNRIVDKI
jgi:hypothetical protein